MRLSDAVLRRGHLSEDALVEVWTTGSHPPHLDECALCASRAVDMSRWLEDVQATGRADADAVLTEARLAEQKHRVLDRLAQLDRPSKVISFPAAAAASRDTAPRAIRFGWVTAAAAAAGIMLGVMGMELSHMLRQPDQTRVTAPASAPATQSVTTSHDIDLIEGTFDGRSFGSLDAMSEMTPRLADVVLASSSRR